MSNAVELLGKELIDGHKQKVNTASAVQGKKVIGLYFSAHWCPPCRQFTPVLKEFYLSFHDTKQFEIVFVSSDKDKGQWEAYFKEMPWIALPYEDRSLKDKLSQKFNVRGIPCLILLDADGNMLTNEGRQMVTEDPSGSGFPWSK